MCLVSGRNGSGKGNVWAVPNTWNVYAELLVSADHSDHRIYRTSSRARRGAFPRGVPPQRLAQLDR